MGRKKMAAVGGDYTENDLYDSHRHRDGHWVKDQLSMHNVLQKDLARAMNMDASTISRVVAGQRRLRPEELHAAQEFFNGFGQRSGNRLAEALSRSTWSADALSRATGIPRERIIILSSPGRLDATDHEDQLLTRALGIERGYFLGADADQVEPRSVSSRTIPILAAPRSLGDGWFEMSSEVADEFPVPRGLEKANGAHGIFIGDDELAPQFIGGSVIFIHPLKGPASGRMAMVLDGTRAAFGRIASISGSQIELQSGRTTMKIDRGDTIRVRVIVGVWFE